MMHKRLALVILLFLVSSCSGIVFKEESNAYSDSLIVELIKPDALRILLPRNRPSSMSIMTPGGKWYIIQSTEDKIEAIPQSQFNEIKTIEFKVSNLEGIFWSDGEKIKEIVFRKNGEYLIYFADNLETEPENTFSLSKKVIYQGY